MGMPVDPKEWTRENLEKLTKQMVKNAPASRLPVKSLSELSEEEVRFIRNVIDRTILKIQEGRE